MINHLQKFRPTAELPEDLTDNALPEDRILQAELLDTLAAALEKLPDELTDIIVLRYYDRLPLTEIAPIVVCRLLQQSGGKEDKI